MPDETPEGQEPKAKRTRKAAAPEPSPAAVTAPDDQGDGSQRTWSNQAAREAVWGRLTASFDPDWIERLPKPLNARDERKGRCEATGNGGLSPVSADGHHCGGWHSRAVHLDYVGHAGITMRLNDVLGPDGWDFTPYAHDQQGVPVMSQSLFWASLTVRVLDSEPVTKSDLAASFRSPQEAYGDALRRCAMRFGIGTYLWSKSDQAHQRAVANDVPPEPEPDQAPQEDQPQGGDQPPQMTNAQLLVNQRVLGYHATIGRKIAAWWNAQGVPRIDALTDEQATRVMAWLDEQDATGWPDPPA